MFAITRIEPSGAAHAFYAIHCSICGTSMGVTDSQNNAAQLNLVLAQLKEMKAQIERTDYNVRVIGNALQRQLA